MELIQPGIGLIFWMTIGFLLLLWILGRFAWKPIMKGLKDREETISEALHAADRAREEMSRLKSTHEQLLKEAREEREMILSEARNIRDTIVENAKNKANEDAARIIENAKESIQFEKMAAITDLKNQLATLSIEIAEKILKEELSSKNKHNELVNKLLDEIHFN
ncbi:MAG: F0F1 ATP synthase subunit B [Bacteroidales bacterium]|nr:F0F1 ATP synthase subunit B [Bacteroidales bacterium]